MRSKICIGVMFFYSCFACGQTNIYHEFPDSNAFWNYFGEQYLCGLGGFVTADYSIAISGDTTVNSKVYHKINIPFVSTTAVNCPFILATSGYKGCYREDVMNKKVYFVSPLDSAEELLYDFNWQVGDTVVGVIGGPGQYIDVVQSIDSVLVGNDYRKRWVINTCYGIDIIEGIGSTYGLIIPSPICFTDLPSYSLSCFKQDNMTLYNPLQSSCNLITGTAASITPAASLKVFPVPSSGPINIEVLSNDINRLKLYHSTGSLVKEIFPRPNQIIKLEKLNAGSYYLMVFHEDSKIETYKIMSGP